MRAGENTARPANVGAARLWRTATALQQAAIPSAGKGVSLFRQAEAAAGMRQLCRREKRRSFVDVVVVGETPRHHGAVGLGPGVGEGEGQQGIGVARLVGVVFGGGSQGGGLVVGELDVAKPALVIAHGGHVGVDLLGGGDLEGFAGQAVHRQLVDAEGGEAGRAAGHRVEEEGGHILVKEDGGVVPDHHGAAGDGPAVQQGLQEGLVRILHRGVQGAGGDGDRIRPEEGGGAGVVLPIGDPQLVGEGPGGLPGKVHPVLVPQGPEEEGEELGGGDGVGGAEGGGAHAVGVPLIVGVPHIGLGPGGHIGEGGVPGAGQGLVLGPQEADQDGDGLGPGGGPVQGEVGGAVGVGAGTQEEPQVIQQLRVVLGLLRRGGQGGHRQGEGQAQGQEQRDDFFLHDTSFLWVSPHGGENSGTGVRRYSTIHPRKRQGEGAGDRFRTASERTER